MAARKKRIEPASGIEGSAGSHERDIRWVMSNLSSSPSERQAPSPAAWSMFEIASADAESKKAFMERVYSKIVSKEKPPEQSKSISDDQRRFFRLFELLEQERPVELNNDFPRTVVRTDSNVPAAAAVPGADVAARPDADGAESPDGAAPRGFGTADLVAVSTAPEAGRLPDGQFGEVQASA
ncbi:MAG: hypothetical protein ACYCQK_01495 [Acidiferrobacteraceae bacterium]